MSDRLRRIYIAGPMTGIANYNRKAFWEAAKKITEETCLVPVHTAWIELGFAYNDYIELSLDLLWICDIITALPDWERSAGARREVRHATQLGIPFVELDDLFDRYPKHDY